MMPMPAVPMTEAAAVEEAAPHAPDVAKPVPAVLDGVLRVEAQGNHVLVVTDRGRHVLPGPFGALVALLPADMGRQVHRSHWVACRAVLRTRRSGRYVMIETIDGAQVPIASTKFGALRAWLAAATRHAASDPARRAEAGGPISK